jgi:cytochrome P450
VSPRTDIAAALHSASPPDGFRTYEVYQRQRVGESTAKITPRQLFSPGFLADPYPTLAILREDYPCYRDWIGNSFWISRYDDVTSVFVDEANFESRPNRWLLGLPDGGRDLADELPVLIARARSIDLHAPAVTTEVVADIAAKGRADLAVELAARLPVELLARVLGLPAGDVPLFAERYWRLHRGVTWDPAMRAAGLSAATELTDYFEPLLQSRRDEPADDLLSVIAALDVEGGSTTAADVVATLLEDDHETLHGGLANLWFLLMTDPGERERVTADRRLVRFAWLEALRHSAPVLSANRFARHEVERFGRLLPEGALVVCSAGAANRDPRAFDDPDSFVVGRKDLCQREPRGSYRADGLPSGIAFGLGPPSKFPAVPEDRPRSRYAITRDIAVGASHAVLDALTDVRLADGATPSLRSLHLGGMHTCWSLPVEFTPR